MKVLLLLAFATLGQCALFGSRKCTYGPSYWCSHIDHARECSAMQHCITTVWKNQRMDMIGSTETCFDIIKVVDVVRQSNENDFMEQWAIGCTGLPSAKRQLCKDLMRTNMKEVTMLLKSDLTSRQVASALKLCGGFADRVPKQVKTSGDNYCQDCINFIGDLREIVNNSEGKAVDIFKSKVCSQTGALKSVCDQLVDQYGEMVFNIIYHKMEPQDICHMLRMCANQTRTAMLKDFKRMLTQRQRGAEECNVCKSLAKDIQEVLQDQTLQNDLISALENNLCPILGSFADQCKTYVAQYAPVVFQIIVAELDPQTVCQTLHLCNSSKVDQGRLIHVPLTSSMGAVQIKAPQDKANSLECSACKYLVNKLKEEIEDGKSAEEALKNLCKDLPASVRDDCTELVNQYGQEVINFLLAEVDPGKVCKLIGICTSTKALQADESGLAAFKTSGVCTVCLKVMEHVQKEVNSSGAKTLEKKILEEICDDLPLPDAEKTMCKLFVDENYADIAKMIEKETDPNKICSIIKLCGKSVTPSKNHALKFLPMTELRPAAERPLLGREKCTYGPSFWCASDENARLCDAVEHCNKMKNRLGN